MPCWSQPGVATATTHIGLIPVATVTHTEPFHISKAIATLDFVSHGRAGWQVRVSTSHEAQLFGRRALPGVDLFDEAGDVVEVVRRLWDSWEDDAVIRDVATGRFVDRDKLHCVSISPARTSPSRGPRSHRGLRRVNPSSPLWHIGYRCMNSPPTVLIWSSSRRRTTIRCAQSSARSDRPAAPTSRSTPTSTCRSRESSTPAPTQSSSTALRRNWSNSSCAGSDSASTASGCGQR